MREEKFKKVIENEYNIDLVLNIILPLISVILGFLFGYFQYKDMPNCSLITGCLLFFSSLVYLAGLKVWLEGRKVYWVKIKEMKK